MIFLTLIGLLSCTHSGQKGITNIEDRFKHSLDSIIYNHYVEAVNNESTFQFYLVAKMKNLNTGQIREICTEGNFLDGALHTEFKLGYDSLSIKKIKNLLINTKTRYFEFKDTAALNNLGINKYSMVDLKNFEKSHNIDSLAQIVKEGKWRMAISNDTTMLLYAHSLFNRGILTGENNCFGGTLVHVEDKLLKEEKEEREEMKRQMDLIQQNRKK
jgi:hypothetical protein